MPVLPQSYQQVVLDAVTVRRDDVRQALSDNVGNISHATLTDFNWTTKVSIWREFISRINNVNNSRTMFMVLSSWQSHCESSPGSFDECRMALSGCRPKTKPTT